MSDASHDIKKEVKGYLIVFGSLLFLTIVTVAVSYLDLSLGKAIALALFIATIKAGLVACYFMHLISEQKLIYAALSLTAVFFIALMLLPISTVKDHLVGTKSLQTKTEAHQKAHH